MDEHQHSFFAILSIYDFHFLALLVRFWIYRIYSLQRDKTSTPKIDRCSGQDTILHLIVRLQFQTFWGVWSYLFIAITPRSTFTKKGCTCYSPIYHSYRSVCKLLVLVRNIWHHISVWKPLNKQPHKNIDIKYNVCNSLISRHEITPDGLTCH